MMVGSPAPQLRPSGGKSTLKKMSPYDRIKQAILWGDLLPDEQLVESALAEWCEVSRTPIREALKRLEQDGLVCRGEQGLVVRASSPEEILDLYDTRIVLENHAASVAAERRNSHDLLMMRRTTKNIKRIDSTDQRALAESNRNFHRTIWRASHNASLIDLLERLNMHLGRYPATTLAYPGRIATADREHLELIEAIEARDHNRAAAIATQHFTAAREIRLRIQDC